MNLVVNLEYFEEIERAIGYNSSSTMSHAESKIMDLLKVLINGGTITIENDNTEIKSIEEYKHWKRNREYLNMINTDNLVQKLNKSVFTISKNEINQIENAIQYNTPSSIKSAESALIKILRNVIISEPVLIEAEGHILSSTADYNKWIKGRVFEAYDSKILIALMKQHSQSGS